MRWLLALSALGACGRIGFAPIDDGGGAGDATVPRNVVFVSSTKLSPVQNFPDAFDAECQRLAASHFTGRFVAWMSGPGAIAARQRIAGAHGFVRVDGLPIADDTTQISSAMRRPIVFDETGTPIPSNDPVMTGSDPDGNDQSDCNGYSETTDTIDTGFADAVLVEAVQVGALTCGASYHVYCVGLDHDSNTAEPPPTGRRVFLGSATDLGGGVAMLDTQCMSDALGAGLAGNFLALAATETASAASRFSAAGANWVRQDGVAIAATPVDFLAGNWLAPISMAADSSYSAADVWFGADNLVTPGTATNTCASWTVGDASTPFMGDSAAIPPRAFHTPGTSVCNTTSRVYCVEQ